MNDREVQHLTLGQRLQRLVLAAVNLYAVFLILYLPLRSLFGDRLWPVAILNILCHWLLLPALVLLPVAMWLRRRLAAAVLGVSGAVFLGLFGGLFLPPPPAPAGSYELTVMTYNVANTRTAPEALVDVLRSSEADVIALQELTDEQAAVVERDVRDLYPHQVLHGGGIPGLGLLSRYPILENEIFYLEAQSLLHLRAVLAVDDVGPGSQATSVTVIVAHPPPPVLHQGRYYFHPYAGAEIASLVQMATAGGPAILMGDLNLTDQNDNYALLSEAGLTDAFRAVGWGFGATWPARGIELPLVRIDYVWSSPHFRPARAWMGPDAGSDHLPVLAELVWQTDGDY